VEGKNGKVPERLFPERFRTVRVVYVEKTQSADGSPPLIWLLLKSLANTKEDNHIMSTIC
jgi:hypothetical protein